jgi:hypothetical protein
MGMAASQARYLELTARKTDVEFQGQQINQQRTELATQSAGLFNELLGMSVPTPPSSTNYTTTAYSFTDGTNDYTITDVKNLTSDPNYNAKVTYSYVQSTYTGNDKIRTDLGVAKVTGTYWLTDGAATNPQNKTKLTQCTAADASDITAVEQIIKDTSTTANPTSFANDYTVAGGGIGNIYKYTDTGGTTYYYGVSQLTTLAGQSGKAGTTDNYYATDLNKTYNKTENAYLTKADSGRYSTIKLASESTPLDVTTKTTTDQNAYQDAMNEYEYKQAQYQQQVNSVNARTSIVQSQDRTLELKLKQLDTEQEALSTELESVKKVIDKNIEQTFKTFQ